MTQQTPLFEQHQACGARIVDFHGWMMPLHHRFFHLFNVRTQVVNAVIIFNHALCIVLVNRAKTVLDNKQRLLITLIERVQRIAQPHRTICQPQSDAPTCGFFTTPSKPVIGSSTPLASCFTALLM